MTGRGWIWAWLLGLVVLSIAPPAAAQPVDSATKASARELAAEGLKLYDAGDCGQALEKLTKAHAMVPVPTLAFYAGKCLEKLGRLVDASEMYLTAMRDDVGPAPAQVLKTAQTDAARARSALLPHLASVELLLPSGAADVVVLLDERALPAAALGAKRPIDPGAHKVEVRRGEAVSSKHFILEDGEVMQIDLEAPGIGTRSTKPPPASSAPGSSDSPGPWVVGGAGIAVLVVGAITGGLVLQKKGVADAGCNIATMTCTHEGKAAADAGRVLGPLTTVAFVAGGLGLAAGGIWLALRPTQTKAGQAPRARMGVGPIVGGAAWRMEGSW